MFTETSFRVTFSWFLLWGFCLTFLFSSIILWFWFFLFSFCFVDFGFCCGDFVWHFCFQLLFSGFGFSCSAFVSLILVFAVGILFHQCMLCLARNVVCFRCFGFGLWRFVSCMHCVFCRDCCSNMHLVFDRGMMMVGGMFPNIFMHV